MGRVPAGCASVTIRRPAMKRLALGLAVMLAGGTVATADDTPIILPYPPGDVGPGREFEQARSYADIVGNVEEEPTGWFLIGGGRWIQWPTMQPPLVEETKWAIQEVE